MGTKTNLKEGVAAMIVIVKKSEIVQYDRQCKQNVPPMFDTVGFKDCEMLYREDSERLLV